MPAQFAVIPTLTQAVSGPSSQSESTDNTFDANESNAGIGDQPLPELQRLISAQVTRIADLEYQVEESRMRQRGLDEEIRVREEITADINRQVREARKQLMDAAGELESLNHRYLQMRAKHDAAESAVEKLRTSLALQGEASAAKNARITELEELTTTAAAELADLRNYVEGRKAVWHRREAENAVLQAELKQLRQGVREPEAATPNLKPDNESAARDHTAGSPVSDSDLEKLRKDNERFEGYANELRIKLQDQVAATRESTSMRQALEANLDVASRMINDLTANLERERAASRELEASVESLKSEFAREKRQIRFELDAAQQTITDQDSMNQQLASDLIDNKGFRQALETHLSDVEKDHAKTIAGLEEALASADARTEEYEHKLRIKDGAIADLMKELADQSSKLKLTGELENALQKIDGDRPGGSGGAASPRKSERVTRQLIGSADGKELRFPLFRNRLSIGRTRHNDIQLDLRFVSRRHAVIAADSNATRIIDWGSRNGVYVNKKRITEKVLKSGDVITIGLTNLRYEERAKR